jgi:hypothetical protein
MGRFVSPSHEAITIGLAMATPISSPVFTPGMTVNHQGETAAVESDDGETVVLIYSRRVPVPPRSHDGENFAHTGKATAVRAELVRANLNKFITGANQ